jgi:hypothetical protein
VAALGDCERHVQILDRGEEPGVIRTDFGVIQLAG